MMDDYLPVKSKDENPVRVGVIGAGRIGAVHVEALDNYKSADVVVIADFIIEAAQRLAAKFGVPHSCKEWKNVIDDDEVDAVVICSPADTHFEIICAAARAHKHVFCEKPIDYDLERINKALAEVAKSGIKFQLGFQRRFDNSFMRVRDAVRNGEIGKPYMLNIISRDPAPPPIEYLKKSGGLFFDMMIHDFDMARYTMGCEATEVLAAGMSFDPDIEKAGDITSAIVTLKFENNAIGVIQCCRKAVYGYDQRIEILGSNGSVEIGNNYPNNAVVSTSSAVKKDLPVNFFMDRYKEAYAQEMREFIEAVKNDTPVPVGGHDGKVPVILAYAAGKALAEGRKVPVREIGYESRL